MALSEPVFRYGFCRILAIAKILSTRVLFFPINNLELKSHAFKSQKSRIQESNEFSTLEKLTTVPILRAGKPRPYSITPSLLHSFTPPLLHSSTPPPSISLNFLQGR